MIQELIRTHFPLLAQPDLLADISAVGTLQSAKEGEILMEVGRYIQSMPLVLEGLVKIIREDEEGNEILLYYLEGGKTCAMSMTCCMQQEKSNIRAVVEEDAQMINIPVRYVDEWMMRHQAWKNFILLTYNQRFEQLLHAIDVIAFKKMDERLLHYLREKIKASEKAFISSTHQEIAYELNTSREVISRMLKKLELAGLIGMRTKEIRLLS
jgi:CRP/FNR family transcriptional regulator